MNTHTGPSLYDYKDRLPWIGRLGWPEDRLREVPVHEAQPFDEPFLSLPLADLPSEEGTRGLYVFRSDVTQDIYEELAAFISQGAAGGQREPGMFGPEYQASDDRSHPI